MIQASLLLQSLDVQSCMESFYPRYTHSIHLNLTKEEWVSMVKSKSDPQAYLYTILNKNSSWIVQELNSYVLEKQILGIVVKEFRATSEFTLFVEVDFKQFLNCDFIKAHIPKKFLAPLKHIPNIEKCIGIGNTFQKPFYPEIQKVLEKFGVTGEIERYTLKNMKS